MILPEEDAKLFFDLLWGLQLYVHRTKGFRPAVSTIPQLVKIPPRRRQPSRKAMWEEPALRRARIGLTRTANAVRRADGGCDAG